MTVTEQDRDGNRPSSSIDVDALSNLPTVMASAPLGEQLYRVLEEAIINGDLAPGQRLDEKQLANYFGVSRIPLREAFRALEVGGWIEKARPRQGMRVREITEDELEKLSEVRQALEGECAALAARRRSDEQLDRLREIVAESVTALQRDDRRLLVQLNTEFHGILAQCTQNEVFEDILSTLDKRVRRFLWIVEKERLNTSAAEHKALVNAIARKDARAARAIARRHAMQHAGPGVRNRRSAPSA